jgi:acyl-coenzyme A thioesterase PaaI-like protein
MLQRGKKCAVSLRVEILDDDNQVAEFSGQYWVLPEKQALG